MENFILSLLLWVGYICVVSWLGYNPALATKPALVSTTTTVSEELPYSYSTKTSAPTIQLIKELKYLEARKVASQLNIKQKVNGVNKKLDFLQQEIRQKFQSTPEQVTSIVTQIIAARKLQTSRVQTSLVQKLPA
ncbi:MAG TPA: hypothetical protein DD379_22235 [Cyanobacteria bacterium UBA11162]|nr:hypothetical protein [Cyanobacteria bacterium UBA11162]